MFYGIVIQMYWQDHDPAHFHVRYGGDQAVIAIESEQVMRGGLPSRALALVREWAELHRDKLFRGLETMSSQTNAEVNRATEVGAIEWNVVEVKAGPGRKLQVRFADGTSGMVRFDDGFFTGVFEALKDDALFRRAYVEHGAVTWPGELDLAPDAMYDEIKRNGEWVLR